MRCWRKRKKKACRPICVSKREEKVVAETTNEARAGNISGLLNITVQVPIQVGTNAQNLIDSNNTSSTVI